jgi:Na+/H+-dicarboxylate symporter/ABC-type amino acid transport substrate-binding protein
MTSSNKIFLALGLGILTGLFFGEMISFLQIPANIYVLLLQMTVLPYVTLSLIVGFGKLTYSDAKMLALRGGGILLLLWSVAFAFLFIIPLAYPDWQSPSFFSTTLLEDRKEVDYFEIFIPSNPFNSMSRNFVPAVVVFSICIGVALIGIQDKDHLIHTFSILKEALTRVTDFMVSLMPIGVFLISASAAGTMHIEELERLQVHLILFILITLLFTFWILPGLVAALTTIKYRDIIGISKEALVTAFMTATLLVVLPLLAENGKALLNRYKLGTDRSDAVLDAAIPTSFNFPQTGKLLSMSFILFAAWFSGHPLSFSDYPLLMVSGLASFFGSLNVAVPFLLDLFHIPADMFQLFLVAGILNSRFGSLIAAMHTLVLGLLVTCAVTGHLRFNLFRIFRFMIITVVLTVAAIGGAASYFSYGLTRAYTKNQVLEGMHLMTKSVKAVVYKTSPENLPHDAPGLSKLDAIRQRGYLRVGYLAENMPYAFFNGRDELVGFDVEMAHLFAKELGLTLEFVPIKRGELAKQLDSNYCDVIMSGLVKTIRRVEQMDFSRSYLSETVAFVVKDHYRDEFTSAEARAKIKSIRIADASNRNPDYMHLVQHYFPQAEFVPIQSIEEFFTDKQDRFDAILGSAERGSAWSLLYPEYSVALPRPNLMQLPLAYAVSYRYPEFIKLVNAWVEMKKNDGTIDTLYDYWVLGKNAVPAKPRWSIIRNVLN